MSDASPWIDVSVALRHGMVHWPDNPEVVVERVQDIAHGDVATVSRISLGVHTATHMDAPNHFLAGTPGIDDMPFEATVGVARVVRVEDPVALRAAEVERIDPQPDERLLLRTDNSDRVWDTDEFQEDFVYIARDAAALLAERRVRTVGVDYLSVGGFHEDGVETHHHLLGAGIWIIEGLDLRKVDPGMYDLVCLPLKIADGDGAPARAIVRARGTP